MKLTPWSRVLEKLIVTHLVKKLPTVYGTQRFSIVYARAANGPYPETDESSPQLPTLFS
jgi:hypothetical protein